MKKNILAIHENIGNTSREIDTNFFNVNFRTKICLKSHWCTQKQDDDYRGKSVNLKINQ